MNTKQKLSNATKSYYASLTPEQKQARADKIRQSNILRAQQMTPEQKQARIEKFKRSYAKLNKSVISAKISIKQKQFHSTKTQEQKHELGVKMGKANKSTKEQRQEQFKKWYSKLSIEQIENINKKKSEDKLRYYRENPDKTILKENGHKLKKYYSELSEENKKALYDKIFQTKKENGTTNSSNWEDKYYQQLLAVYNREDIVRQYKDERYPFACDFYIKSCDLFIECDYGWRHGGEEFDSNNKEHQERLKLWHEKANLGHFDYASAITTWTIRDKEKIRIAKENNIKMLRLYNN